MCICVLRVVQHSLLAAMYICVFITSHAVEFIRLRITYFTRLVPMSNICISVCGAQSPGDFLWSLEWSDQFISRLFYHGLFTLPGKEDNPALPIINPMKRSHTHTRTRKCGVSLSVYFCLFMGVEVCFCVFLRVYVCSCLFMCVYACLRYCLDLSTVTDAKVWGAWLLALFSLLIFILRSG